MFGLKKEIKKLRDEQARYAIAIISMLLSADTQDEDPIQTATDLVNQLRSL